MVQYLKVASYVVIILAAVKLASAIIVPFLLSAFLAILLTPAYLRLRGLGMPTYLALAVVVLGLGLILFLATTILRGSINDFAANASVYEATLRQRLEGPIAWLQSVGIDLDQFAFGDVVDTSSMFGYVTGFARSLSGILGQGFIIFFVSVFMLIEASSFHAKLSAISHDNPKGMGIFEESLAAVRGYVSIKTIMSLLTGVAVCLLLYVLKVDNYIFFGFLAFILNYVPNIGSVIAAIPGVVLALILHGLGYAAIAAAGYLVINVTVSNIIEPRFVGSKFGISPLIVIISLLFWGWLLGPTGMLLSVPLTMFTKIALENTPQTQAIAILLGDAPKTDVT